MHAWDTIKIHKYLKTSNWAQISLINLCDKQVDGAHCNFPSIFIIKIWAIIMLHLIVKWRKISIKYTPVCVALSFDTWYMMLDDPK